MKNRYGIIIQAVLLIFLIAPLAFAAPNLGTIDGSMGDEWIGFQTSEDSVGSSGYVGPGYGGQDFDIEKIGIYVDDEYLYIGLQTGFELNNEEDGVLPGDIAIGFGTISGPQDYQIGLRFDFGSFQDEDTFNFTSYYPSRIDDLDDADLIVLSADVWNTVKYDSSNNDEAFTVQTGDDEGSVEADGMGFVSYNRYQSDGTPYTVNNDDPYYNTIEAAIRLDDLATILGDSVNLDNAFTANIFWTMGCNNDELGHSTTYTPTTPPSESPVPEPTTLILFGFGLIGAGALGRRKMENKQA